MLIFLPVVFFILLILVFHQPDLDWRQAYLKACVATATFIVVLTEFLSFFHVLVPAAVMALWLIGGVVSGMMVWRKKGWDISLTVESVSNFSLTEKMMVFGIVSIALVIGFIAMACAPNTWDAMTYHLSRVEHWIQNRSLAPYPTIDLRQIAYCPFPEYGILQTMMLANSDRFVNCVQYVSMLGSWVIVSMIAAALGADRKAQLLTVLLAATVPMGILQGSSTQTDYVATLWICAFVFIALTWCKEFSWGKGWWAGLILGLSWLTKGYAYVYTFPSLLILIVSAVWPWKNRKVKVIGLILSVALLLNAGYFIRNWESSGSLFGHAELTANTKPSLAALTANLLRNMGTHLGTPIGPLNQHLDRVFANVAGSIDPTRQVQEFHVHKMSSDEDDAGNLLHLCLGFVSFIMWLMWHARTDRLLRQYTFCLVGILLLFCLTIKWNAYISRYHLPLFILACPWMGVIWSRVKAQAIVTVLAILFYVAAQFWLWDGNPRHLLGRKSFLKKTRIEQYFAKKMYLEPVYENFSQDLRTMNCTDIGLKVFSDDEWEYPWWVLLKQNGHDPRIEYISDANQPPLAYPLRDFVPCAIVGTDTDNSLTYHNVNYSRVVSALGWSVFIKK